MNNFGERNRGFSRRGPRKPVPVEEGKEYEVIVEGVGSKGDGIARHQGFVIVVPEVEAGDKIKVRVDAVRGKVSFGTVVEKLGKATPEEMPATESKESDSATEADAEEDSADESKDVPEAEEESEAAEEGKAAEPVEDAPEEEPAEEAPAEADAEKPAEEAPEAEKEQEEEKKE